MKYLFLICVNDATNRPVQGLDVGAATDAWFNEMNERKKRLVGERLRPREEATTVSVIDGKLTLSDGPFAETKDFIGGFDLIECKDLDEAIEIAAKHPVAQFGAIEIRPIWVWNA
jgi:hypothetical protein